MLLSHFYIFWILLAISTPIKYILTLYLQTYCFLLNHQVLCHLCSHIHAIFSSMVHSPTTSSSSCRPTTYQFQQTAPYDSERLLEGVPINTENQTRLFFISQSLTDTESPAGMSSTSTYYTSTQPIYTVTTTVYVGYLYRMCYSYKQIIYKSFHQYPIQINHFLCGIQSLVVHGNL